MGTPNRVKTPPKNNIKFSITLSDEQKKAKAQILLLIHKNWMTYYQVFFDLLNNFLTPKTPRVA